MQQPRQIVRFQVVVIRSQHRSKKFDSFLRIRHRRGRQRRGVVLRECRINEVPTPVAVMIREADILERDGAAGLFGSLGLSSL